MKNIKKVLFLVLATIMIWTLSSCNFDFGKLIVEHEFSDDGISETNLFFAGLKNEDFVGSVTWEMNITTGSQSKDYTIRVDTKKEEEVEYTAFSISTDEKDYRILIIDEASYFINETDMEYQTITSSTYNTLYGIVFHAITYGIVKFENEDSIIVWEFEERREAKINNMHGNEVDTMEFEYNKVESQDVMLINFKLESFAGVVAYVERLFYQTYNDSVLTETTIFFAEWPSSVYNNDKFIVPNEDSGYTLVTP